MPLADSINDHWAKAIAGVIVAACGGTWYVAENTRVKPMEEIIKAKDAQIELHKATISELREKLRDVALPASSASAGPSQALRPASVAATSPQALTTQPLDATWVEEGKPLEVLNHQVQVVVSWPRPSSQTVMINLELPSGPLNIGVTTPSTPRPFSLDGQTYLLRVLEVSDNKAKLSISKK